jgi:hypothetical protein
MALSKTTLSTTRTKLTLGTTLIMLSCRNSTNILSVKMLGIVMLSVVTVEFYIMAKSFIEHNHDPLDPTHLPSMLMKNNKK